MTETQLKMSDQSNPDSLPEVGTNPDSGSEHHKDDLLNTNPDSGSKHHKDDEEIESTNNSQKTSNADSNNNSQKTSDGETIGITNHGTVVKHTSEEGDIVVNSYTARSINTNEILELLRKNESELNDQ